MTPPRSRVACTVPIVALALMLLAGCNRIPEHQNYGEDDGPIKSTVWDGPTSTSLASESDRELAASVAASLLAEATDEERARLHKGSRLLLVRVDGRRSILIDPETLTPINDLVYETSAKLPESGHRGELDGRLVIFIR